MNSHHPSLASFVSKAIELLKQSSSILILVRYPYQAGNKDFFLNRSEAELSAFLLHRKPQESLSLFYAFEELLQGKITEEFMGYKLETIKPPKQGDYLLIFPTLVEDWEFCETKNEIRDSLRSYRGKVVHILTEPDPFNEQHIFHTYVPDEQGMIRPGAY